MSDRVNAAAQVVGDEYVKAISSGTPSTWRHQIARALDAAGLLTPEMKTEWGVVDQWGDVVWFIPTDYVDVDDEGAKRMAEAYAAKGDDFLLVRRHVTGVITDG